MNMISDIGIENLCNAIIQQAARDYEAGRICQAKGKEVPKDCDPEEVMEFFKSEDFLMLTNTDQDTFIRKLEEKVDRKIQVA